MTEIILSDTDELPGYIAEDLRAVGLVYGISSGFASKCLISARDEMKKCAANLQADGVVRVTEHLTRGGEYSDSVVVLMRGMAVKAIDDSEKL